MTDLELMLKQHDWGTGGHIDRPMLDKLIKENPDSGPALWEQYCPWSDTNGGYIKWTTRS
jgi:hypothetical protein